MEIPIEWERRLREVSPISDAVSWLALRFHPDFERLVLYENVPIRYVDDNTLIEDLAGPDPSTEAGKDVLVSSYQQEMFRKHRVHARPCWIIQGERGGNKVEFSDSDRELCRAYGLPTEPPKPGSLPYAPFDERVVRQILAMSKLTRFKNDIGAFKIRYGTVEGQKQEYKKAMEAARLEYIKYLNEQFAEPAEHFIAAAAKGEMDNHKRVEDDFQKLDEQADAKYYETGRF